MTEGSISHFYDVVGTGDWSADMLVQYRQDLTRIIPEGWPIIAQHFNVGGAGLDGHKSRRDG